MNPDLKKLTYSDVKQPSRPVKTVVIKDAIVEEEKVLPKSKKKKPRKKKQHNDSGYFGTSINNKLTKQTKIEQSVTAKGLLVRGVDKIWTATDVHEENVVNVLLDPKQVSQFRSLAAIWNQFGSHAIQHLQFEVLSFASNNASSMISFGFTPQLSLDDLDPPAKDIDLCPIRVDINASNSSRTVIAVPKEYITSYPPELTTLGWISVQYAFPANSPALFSVNCSYSVVMDAPIPSSIYDVDSPVKQSNSDTQLSYNGFVSVVYEVVMWALPQLYSWYSAKYGSTALRGPTSMIMPSITTMPGEKYLTVSFMCICTTTVTQADFALLFSGSGTCTYKIIGYQATSYSGYGPNRTKCLVRYALAITGFVYFVPTVNQVRLPPATEGVYETFVDVTYITEGSYKKLVSTGVNTVEVPRVSSMKFGSWTLLRCESAEETAHLAYIEKLDQPWVGYLYFARDALLKLGTVAELPYTDHDYAASRQCRFVLVSGGKVIRSPYHKKVVLPFVKDKPEYKEHINLGYNVPCDLYFESAKVDLAYIIAFVKLLERHNLKRDVITVAYVAYASEEHYIFPDQIVDVPDDVLKYGLANTKLFLKH